MKPVTLKDIAQKSDIAFSEVSRVLNNKQTWLSLAKREKILRIAQELNYQPNYFARSLKLGKTHSIGLMGGLGGIVDVSAYCFSKVTESIEETLAETKSKYSLIIFGANFQETQAKSVQLVERGIVDGLILIILSQDLEKFEHELMPILNRMNLPYVVVHAISKPMPFHNVGMDSHYAGYCAAEHFIQNGYRKIGFYLREANSPQQQELLAGYRQACTDHAVVWDSSCVIEQVPDTNNCYEQAYHSIMRMTNLPRAVFFGEDESAYGALAACRDRGIRVPEDLAVIGCDDEQPTNYFKTDLTTVHHPFVEKGRAAVEILTGILDGTRQRDTIHSRIFKPHLVVRKTCGDKRTKEVG